MAEDPTRFETFHQKLLDGSEIITIDKTWCWECPFFKPGDKGTEWECEKFPFVEGTIGDWYDGPLRRIECMRETGDHA